MGRLLFVLGLVACSPSVQEIRSARDATYAADPRVIAKLAADVATDWYGGVEYVDEVEFVTRIQHYTFAGDPGELGAGAKVAVTFRVAVRPAENGERATVTVTPFITDMDFRRRTRTPGDVPGWAQQRADMLAVAIHERVRRYLKM